MKKEIRDFLGKNWELVEHFKYSNKMNEGLPMATSYVLSKNGFIDEDKKFIMINNEKHIMLLYNRGGGLYKEVSQNE